MKERNRLTYPCPPLQPPSFKTQDGGLEQHGVGSLRHRCPAPFLHRRDRRALESTRPIEYIQKLARAAAGVNGSAFRRTSHEFTPDDRDVAPGRLTN